MALLPTTRYQVLRQPAGEIILLNRNLILLNSLRTNRKILNALLRKLELEKSFPGGTYRQLRFLSLKKATKFLASAQKILQRNSADTAMRA
jgi:hypothetical protein